MNPRNIIIPLAVVALTFSACGSDDAAESEVVAEATATAEITIDDPWVREPAEGQTRAAGYGTITNGTDEAVTLIGASAPIIGTFEIHETLRGEDGVMSMAEKTGGFEIAPGESFTLEPGGAHIMMLGIDPTEFTGPLDLTFVFDTAQVVVSAELREIGDTTDGMDDGGMDDGGVDDSEMDDDSMEDAEDGT